VDISDDNDEGVVDEKEEGIILSDEDQLIEGDTRENKQLRNNNEDDNAGSTEDNAKLLNMIAENVVGPDNSSKDSEVDKAGSTESTFKVIEMCELRFCLGQHF